MEKRISRARRMSLLITLAGVVAVSLGISHQMQSSAGGRKPARRVLYYVDPMHPSYRSDKPGTAPDCGMALEAVFADTQAPAAQQTIHVPASMQKAFGVRYVTAEKQAVTRSIRVVGRVKPEDAKVFTLNAGVDGFIRETYNDSVGLSVVKDQKLASYYAPEFIAAASGFLAASERVPGSVANEGARSIQNYSDRLRNLGMSDVQIHHIAEARQLPESIDIVSPTNGVVLSRSISPGQHFGHEMQFYQIANLSEVWIVAEIDPQDQRYLRPGSQATISLRGETRTFAARVAESLPETDANGGTVKLRLKAENRQNVLRPDMLVDLEFPVRLPEALTVPAEALVDSGTTARVYVAHEGGAIESREVEAGWRAADFVEIRHGLKAGEQVVAGGAFLIDSETRLRAPAQPQQSARNVAAVKSW